MVLILWFEFVFVYLLLIYYWIVFVLMFGYLLCWVCLVLWLWWLCGWFVWGFTELALDKWFWSWFYGCFILIRFVCLLGIVVVGCLHGFVICWVCSLPVCLIRCLVWLSGFCCCYCVWLTLERVVLVFIVCFVGCCFVAFDCAGFWFVCYCCFCLMCCFTLYFRDCFCVCLFGLPMLRLNGDSVGGFGGLLAGCWVARWCW